VKVLLKYVLSLLKILASIIGLLVASGTTILVMDMASIRIEDINTTPTDLGTYIELSIQTKISSRAYFFQVKDANLTLIIKTDNNDIVDWDSRLFHLSPGQFVLLNFTLDIPKDVFLQFQSGQIDLYTDISLNMQMGYQNYNLIGLTMTTTIPMERE